MFSLVFPVYNEETLLEKNAKIVIDKLNDLKINYEIIIAEDGSTDKTYEIGKIISKKYKNVKIIHCAEKLGRGLALKKTFLLAKGEYVGYMDIDLATDVKHIKEIIDYVQKYDVVTGSRYMKNSKANRSYRRKIFSKVYNFLARFLFKSKIYDHQCGFKAFRRDVIIKLNEISENNHWFWDTEILILADKKGYNIKEFPIRWIEGNKTKVRVPTDSFSMFLNLMKLRVKKL